MYCLLGDVGTTPCACVCVLLFAIGHHRFQETDSASVRDMFVVKLKLRPQLCDGDVELLLQRAEGTSWRLREVEGWIKSEQIKRPRVLCLVGVTGEGKSSVAAALLGEGSRVATHITGYHFVRVGGVQLVQPQLLPCVLLVLLLWVYMCVQPYMHVCTAAVRTYTCMPMQSGARFASVHFCMSTYPSSSRVRVGFHLAWHVTQPRHQPRALLCVL
jgi:hypothetical protein